MTILKRTYSTQECILYTDDTGAPKTRVTETFHCQCGQTHISTADADGHLEGEALLDVVIPLHDDLLRQLRHE